MSSKNSSHPDAGSPPSLPPDRATRRLPPQGTGQSPADPAPEPVELGVILAAGAGTRLSRQGSGQPKPTVSLLGLSLSERVILAGMDAGLGRFVVVLGHEKERVRTHFERIARARSCEIAFVEASNWHLGNGASCLAAAQTVGGSRFVLMMVDHLVDPRLIGAVRSAVVPQDGICLGVDHDRDQLPDPDDATKVQIDGDRIIRIGKQLDEWAAADTGVFLCTPALFEALATAASRGRHELSAGVAVLVERGAVRAVDVTGLAWLDVDTPEVWHEARRRLLSSLAAKEGDGLISPLFNRPISIRISARLSSTRITPDQITVASFVLALVGAVLLAIGNPAPTLAGGLIVQASSVLDGCDGEIARLKRRATRRGAWLDTILDRYADTAVTLAITLAAARIWDGPWVWLGGMVALAGFILASYTTKEYSIRHQSPYPNDGLNRLKRRDLRLLGICVGAVAGYPYAALVALGLLSHACVFGILMRGWKLSARTGR